MLRPGGAILTLLLIWTSLSALPTQADNGAVFSPVWVANYDPAALWSGVDDQAVSFGALAQFTPLLATGRAGTRLAVFNPATEGPAYVDVASVGPIGAPFPAVLFTAADGERRLVRVELAQTPAQWQQGLMGRPTLPPDSGMLFVFPAGTTIGFWMKDTPAPLSIAFLDDTGSVLGVQDMQPYSTDVHAPPAPYHYALEVPQGFFAVHGIAAGASAAITLPASSLAPG
ncbi:MAG TPA: DUF192 domain-containing protein [Chloroflexota bacterium]|nr:DUF192 domain-containing protein [Chloroflexota bacterium]